MQFQLTVDTRSVAEALEGIKDGAPKAIARALNRSIKSAGTLAVRLMAADLGITQAAIRKYGALRTDEATWSNLVARFSVLGSRIPLIAFRARQTKTGVAYRLGPGRESVAHAFLATVGAGHEGVFIRSSLERPVRRGRHRAWLPIRELRGPSLPHVLVKQWERQARAQAAEMLQKNLDHEVEFLLAKKGAA